MPAARGPRGGAIKSGRCACDDPEINTVMDVRRFTKALGFCTHCRDRGLDLVKFGSQRLHVRCLIRKHGILVLSTLRGGWDRARLCCIGKRRMKELLRLREAA